MKASFYILILILAFLSFSCTPEKQYVYIISSRGTEEVGDKLKDYLSKTYPDDLFQIAKKVVDGRKNIILEILSEKQFENDEEFFVSGDTTKLLIQGNTPRAILNGVYGFLEEIGWSFYLSFELSPETPEPLDFSDINVHNYPLKERRIILNWHNFLSGCTVWNYDQWQQWVENSSKIGFNTIMIHAYGNNPIHSFSFNGQEKEIGYLTTSRIGRDWGAQHINDVRLMIGGELFSEYEFGSEAAKVPELERSKSAISLMQNVFQHARKELMDVCFAMDVDTWMANPQNLINTLPNECLMQIAGYSIVNPEHPEGKRYYKAQIKKLLSDYPEINMLACWMRYPRKNPAHGSVWLQYNSASLPKKWQKEYFEILKEHPEMKDEQPYPGIFAISKLIEVYREILDEVNPNIELALGSWRLEYPKQANYFIPRYCGFIPLDYEVVFNDQKVIDELSEVGEKRNLYPIVWAHHDDHRYIGRPYQPFVNFNAKLNQANAKGYGIIHWTTHPLDIYFKNSENQVWQTTENETLLQTINNLVASLCKTKDLFLIQYFVEWFNNAPMFGRETSDYFIKPDEGYCLDGYKSALEVVEKAIFRLKILRKVNIENLNNQGLREYNYQVGMEQFLISFFTNHNLIYQASKLLTEGKTNEARLHVLKTNPEKTIELYAASIKAYGATQGEKGILLSLNLRWLPDYLDIRQQTGIELIRINFQSTMHDSLSQAAGNNTFFIDKDKKIWHSKGEKEIGVSVKSINHNPLQTIKDSWVEIEKPITISLTTIRNNSLPEGLYKLKMIYAEQRTGIQVEVVGGELISQSGEEIILKLKGQEAGLTITPEEGIVRLAGITLTTL